MNHSSWTLHQQVQKSACGNSPNSTLLRLVFMKCTSIPPSQYSLQVEEDQPGQASIPGAVFSTGHDCNSSEPQQCKIQATLPLPQCLREKHLPMNLAHTYLHHSDTQFDVQHAEQLNPHHLSYQNEQGQDHLLTLYCTSFLRMQIWLKTKPNCEITAAIVNPAKHEWVIKQSKHVLQLCG